MSRARSPSAASHATSTLVSSATGSCSDLGALEETAARGSSESPCRAVFPLTYPRDGCKPHEEAVGSEEFPPKRAITEWGGVDVYGS